MPFRVYVIVNRSGNHELKFNWNRQQTRGIPSEFSDGLSLADKDLLFDFQIGLTEFKKLSPSTLYITNCALQEKDAKKVFDRLVQIGVITDGGEGVNTKAIGRNFVNQLVMLPKCLQKRTVCLLFEWEEELVRWRVLEDEEREIRIVLSEERAAGGGLGAVSNLEMRLLEIQGLKRLKPSLRERRASGQDENLPGYLESPPQYRESVGTID